MPDEVRLDWWMEGCRYANIFLPARAEALRPFVDERYAIRGGPGLVSVPTVHDAYLGYEAFVCDEGSTMNGSVTPLLHGGYFTSVQAPDDVAVEGPNGQYYRLLNLVADDRLGPMAAQGFPVATGTATFLEPALDSVRVRLDIEGDGAVEYAIVGLEDGGASRGDFFAEYMVGDDRTAVWRSDYTVHTLSSGRAVVAFPEGTLGAQILGTAPVVGTGITGTWDFHDGSIHW